MDTKRIMKKYSMALAAFLAICCSVTAQQLPVALNATLQTDSSKKSVKSREAVRWGKDSVVISYHSPAVRNRTIWGGVVPFDEVWVSGAHMATNIELPFAVTIGGTRVPKGKYALFTIPKKDQEWVFILNKNWEQHLADEYDAKEDVLRLGVPTTTLSNKVERLQWLFSPSGDKQATLWLVWENVALPVIVNK